MKVIQASFQILTPIDGADILRRIEAAGRICYKSEAAIAEGSAERFVAGIIQRGHESVLEHVVLSVQFIVDRGVSHEIVRHRLASFSQESTRYCNYSADKFGNEVTFIKPYFWESDSEQYEIWKSAMMESERSYMRLLEKGAKPEQARSVLPNSIKTEVLVTANIREWRHILKLRTGKAAHPQMREIMCPLVEELKQRIPVIFDDCVTTGEKEI